MDDPWSKSSSVFRAWVEGVLFREPVERRRRINSANYAPRRTRSCLIYELGQKPELGKTSSDKNSSWTRHLVCFLLLNPYASRSLILISQFYASVNPFVFRKVDMIGQCFSQAAWWIQLFVLQRYFRSHTCARLGDWLIAMRALAARLNVNILSVLYLML